MIYTCPVCQGSGFVPRKMYEVPGVTCSFGSYMNDNGVIQCNSCNGTGVIRKNDWIKCTDRMPPDKGLVLATVKENGKHKDVWPCVQYNKDSQAWEFLEDGAFVAFDTITNPDHYGNYYEVTHWMPWPEPAED